MNLRTRILLFLFLFALAPLIAAAVINLPLVLERAALFYRHAVLQDLRADFRDLDHYLAVRDETVRLLAKLPDPGLLLPADDTKSSTQLDETRAGYLEWVNRILGEHYDIQQVLFLTAQGSPTFWLSRHTQSGNWQPTLDPPLLPTAKSVEVTLNAEHAVVVRTPILLDPDTTNPGRSMTLQLLSPIGNDSGPAIGLVVVTLDLAGLARRDPNTLWVRQNGEYLHLPGMKAPEKNAFDIFPGLNKRFTENKITLWEGKNGDQMIWVPLLRTADNEPLWVGRSVNLDPLESFEQAITLRVVGIIVALIVLIWMAARWIARRVERYGSQLFDGISRMLEQGERVEFNWHASPELKHLGENLTRLGDAHARNTRNLQAHARELEETNRYKSEFLANVSHELRTPLNSILLLSKILAEDKQTLNPTQLEQVSVIRQAGRDLRDLIDNILDLSRIEAGRLELNLTDCALEELLVDIEALMRPQFEAKQLDLTVDYVQGTPLILHTDQDKVRQILKNFLSNALKFTASGQVSLILWPADEPGYAARLAVTDSGIGIAKDKQTVIFQAFKQADGSTNRKYGGTGLGLTISQQLAELLGGEIRVKSEPGKGAEFSLLLPVDKEQRSTKNITQEPEETAQPDTNADKVPEADFSPHKLLIVESDVGELLRLVPVLESWQMQIMAAADLDEALETLCEEADCNLVLLDLDALEYPESEIKMLDDTCHGQPQVIVFGTKPCTLEMIDESLDKPLSLNQLHQTLQRLIGETT